jgi:hypothetical protein
MAATKTVRKKKAALTLEERVEILENSYLFLQSKLKTHGIHLAPHTEDASKPEEEDEE